MLKDDLKMVGIGISVLMAIGYVWSGGRAITDQISANSDHIEATSAILSDLKSQMGDNTNAINDLKTTMIPATEFYRYMNGLQTDFNKNYSLALQNTKDISELRGALHVDMK